MQSLESETTPFKLILIHRKIPPKDRRITATYWCVHSRWPPAAAASSSSSGYYSARPHPAATGHRCSGCSHRRRCFPGWCALFPGVRARPPQTVLWVGRETVVLRLVLFIWFMVETSSFFFCNCKSH